MKRDKGGRKEEKEGGRGQVGMEGDGRGRERKRDVRKEAIAVEGGRDQLISVKMRISLCHMGFSPPSFFFLFFLLTSCSLRFHFHSIPCGSSCNGWLCVYV